MKKFTYSEILKRVYKLLFSKEPYLEIWTDILDALDILIDLFRPLCRVAQNIIFIPTAIVFGPVIAGVVFLQRRMVAKRRELREQVD